MTSDIILELDHHVVRLLTRNGADETEVGSVRLDDPDFAARLAEVRDGIGSEGAPIAGILLPPSLVLFIDIGDADDAAVARRVEAETDCSIDELVVGRSGRTAAAVERATLEEARDFARAHGFQPRSYSARCEDGGGTEVAFALAPVATPTFRSHRFTNEASDEGHSAKEQADGHARAAAGEERDGKAAALAPEPPVEQAEAEGPPDEPAARRDGEGRPPPGAAPIPAPVGAAVDPTMSEADKLTVFGARDRVPKSRSRAPLYAAATVAGVVLIAAYLLLGGGSRNEVEIVALGEEVVEPIGPVDASIQVDPVDADVPRPGAERSEVAVREPDAAERSGAAPKIDSEAELWDAPRSDLTTAVALPEPASLPETDAPSDLHPPATGEIAALEQPPTPPPPPGTVFDMDERGLVRPTEEGALTPNGVIVHSGPPAVLPPAQYRGAPGEELPVETDGQTAGTEDDAALTTSQGEAAEAYPNLARTSPEERPEGEDAPPSPVVLAAGDDTPRPRIRPRSVEQVAVGSASRDEDFEALAEQARAQSGVAGAGFAATRAAEPPEPEPVGQRNVAVRPSLPTRAAVADQATSANAINLERVSLIGVYGSPPDRRALIRLPTGRYLKVKVGDRVDGGRVAAIQSSRVEYVKGGQRYALTLPNG